MTPRLRTLLILCLVGPAAAARGWPPSQAVSVEPAQLERREDLLGREVEVDDRVKYYVPRAGTGDDELQLKRTPVPFLVPRRFRPSTASRLTNVVVRGVLKRDGSRLVCQVTDLQPVPNDVDRLERGLVGLGPRDYQTRKAWAQWAQQRAADFQDDALRKRAGALEAEALRLEGGLRRVGVDAPQEWLAMAQDARRRHVPEPAPSELAHRALRARLAAATDLAGLRAVLGEIQAFFPAAATDRDAAGANLAPWLTPYANDPAAAYRTAPPTIRKALDRRLWADARQRLLEREASQDLPSAVTRSEQAAAELPEKPELPARLLDQALARSRQNLGGLRLAEVKELAALYRDKRRQPEEALKVLREWLEIQRGRLSPTDAEGPVSLANLYDELLQDRVTAIALLRKAWKIDPGSQEIAEAFRTRGYRKSEDDWVEAAPEARAPAAADAPPPAAATTPSLRGLAPEEVRRRMGEPTRISYAASKGQLVEQWIYLDNPKLVRYVNFLRAPGDVKPRLISYYTLPRASVKGGPGPAR
jgi:hypothetical protein